jgi:hypothetical protein
MALKAAVEMAKRRASSMSKERRVEIARHAARCRWQGHVLKPSKSKSPSEVAPS